MKMDRLISIIMLLLERETVSASKLAGTFGVSVRTIYRDIDTIAQAGIPIVTYPGKNGGIGIMEEYKTGRADKAGQLANATMLDKRKFTAADIASMMIGLAGVNPVIPGSETGRTLAKLKGMIPPERLSEIEFQINQIAIDLTPWTKDPRFDERLGVIKYALNRQVTVLLDYIDAYGRVSSREVEPYRLLNKNSRWYLQGFCYLRNEFRTFSFYRMEHLKLTEKRFERREVDPGVFETLGVFDTPMVEVDIRFDDRIKRIITEFYGDGVITSCDNGVYTARILVFDNERDYNMLLTYGECCEVLAPAGVREYIRQRVEALTELYKKNPSEN